MASAIVIGVGGMGAAACYHLARRGVAVTGLERFDLVHDRGSSHGETRLIRKAYFEHPDYVPLLQRAYQLWDALDAGAARPLFHRTGVVMYGSADSAVLAGVRRAASLHGIPIEDLTPARAASFRDGLVPPAGFEAVYEPDAGYLAVEDCVAAHCDAARAAGARLIPRAVVTGWEVHATGVTVRATLAGVEQTLHADRLVLTPGAWAPDLLQWPALDLRPHRVPLFWFASARPLSTSFAFDLPQGFFYGVASRGGLVKIGLHAPGDSVLDPANVDRSLHPKDLADIRAFAASCLPTLASDLSRHAVCMYTQSPDEHFVIDRHPASPRVVVGAGFSGHGFKFASVVGEILADLALDGGTDHPVGFLGASRLTTV